MVSVITVGRAQWCNRSNHFQGAISMERRWLSVVKHRIQRMQAEQYFCQEVSSHSRSTCSIWGRLLRGPCA